MIEVLYFDGCPSHERLIPHLRELLDRAGVDQPIHERRIDSPDQAATERFLGSPTIRIDGIDIEPSAAGRGDYGMQCRIYLTDQGPQGVPSDGMILAALEHASHQAKMAP